MKLETQRLILREWSKRDIPDLIEGLNDFEVSRWLALVPHPYTKKDAEDWVAFCGEHAKKGKDRSAYEFAIELKSEKKVIGGVSLMRISKAHGTAGGGIWLSSKYHGDGYGTEAFNEKIRFAFEELNLRRLENGFFKGNTASFKMQKSLGYKTEGTKRKAYRCRADGKLKDECITGLLQEQWKQNR